VNTSAVPACSGGVDSRASSTTESAASSRLGNLFLSFLSSVTAVSTSPLVPSLTHSHGPWIASKIGAAIRWLAAALVEVWSGLVWSAHTCTSMGDDSDNGRKEARKVSRGQRRRGGRRRGLIAASLANDSLGASLLLQQGDQHRRTLSKWRLSGQRWSPRPRVGQQLELPRAAVAGGGREEGGEGGAPSASSLLWRGSVSDSVAGATQEVAELVAPEAVAVHQWLKSRDCRFPKFNGLVSLLTSVPSAWIASFE
jgi:hypothetical protein